jgi:acyl carrier protein
MEHTIDEKLKKIIYDNANHLKKGEIFQDSDLITDLVLDSLELMTIIIDIEDEFSIEIPDSDLSFNNIRKYSNFLDLIINLNRC